MISNFCLLLLSVVASRRVEQPFARADNVAWFFQTQIDQNNDGVAEFDEFVSTLKVIHPDVLLALQQPDAGEHQINSEYEPIREFIKSRDSNSDGKLTEKEFVNPVVKSFAKHTKQLSFSAADDQASTLQMHLAWGADPTTQMTLTFVNFNKAPHPTIRYRESSSKQYQYVACNTTTYDDGVWGWNGWIYSGAMQNLTPNTTYAYSVTLDGTQPAYTDEQTFTTAPQSVSPSSVTRYAWYGDQGSYFPEGFVVAAAVCAEVREPSNRYAAVIHAGDLAYATSVVGDQKEISSLWDVWTELIACAASRVPYMISVGNHEDPYDFASFGHRFVMPYAVQQFPPQVFWYSLDHEHVHWLFIDTQHSTDGPSTEQLAFVNNDLAQAVANRAIRPWIIVVGHRPMLSSDNSEFDQHNPNSPLYKSYADLFEKYNVDMYLSGHMHMQESLNPIYRNGTVAQYRNSANVYLRPPRTVMIVQGTAGIFMFTETFVQPQPKWSAYRGASDFGFGRMTFNFTHVHYEYVGTYEFEQNKVLDQFWISK